MKLLECFVFGMLSCIITGAGCQRTEVFVAAGSQAVLPCRCNSSACANPFILWTKDSKTNQQTVWKKQRSGLQYFGSIWARRVHCPHFRFQHGDYSLQISEVKESDGGLYTCHVEQDDQQDQTQVMLRVIKVSIKPVVPMSGNYLNAFCMVTPECDGVSMQWIVNNSSFVPATKGDLSVLRVKAAVSMSGNLTCLVRHNNQVGEASSPLSVKGIIHPSRDETKLYAAVGSAATLPCVFSPGLNPRYALWDKIKQDPLFGASSDRLPTTSSPYSSSTRQPADRSAPLSEVTFEDEGRYKCSATVQGHRMARTMQLVVAKIVPSKKGSSVTLTCRLSDASEVTEYEWVHVTYDQNGTESASPTHKGETLTITEGSADSKGEWTCRFYGEKGILGNVTYHTGLMSGLSGGNSSNVSGNTATILGLGFLLTVLLLILLQLFKNYQRRRRIFQFPAMETIVHNNSNEKEERERKRVKI